MPPGISVGIVGMTWHGTVRAGRNGGFVEFYREYYFSGKQGPLKIDEWEDGDKELFLLDDNIPFAEIVWSDCSEVWLL